MNTVARRFSAPSDAVSLSERAYLKLREQILKGQLTLGAALSRRKLAAQFGMSLLPVAEALQRLEGEGLVESRPRIGTRVYLPTAQDIRERYEIREALESQAARLFAEKATVRERMEMEKMAGQMDAMFNRCSSGENDPEFLFTVHSYHLQFHLRIAECTGCRALCNAIEKNHVLIFNWLYDVAARRPPLPARFHRELMDKISQGTVEDADRAMRQHIRYGLDSVVRGIAERSDAVDEIVERGKPARSQKVRV
ncbi:MAG TPA: GntR family transcriptional regulator [Terriglobia bacterium]|nr:GntR family transcriptional regulator [Terriglobia bacterium]